MSGAGKRSVDKPLIIVKWLDENTDRLFVVSYTNGVYVVVKSSALTGSTAGPAAATKLFSISGGANYIGVAADGLSLYLSSYIANGVVYSIANYIGLVSGAKSASTTLNPNGMTTNAGNLTT